MRYLIYLHLFLFALLLALLFVPVARQLALRLGVIDWPQGRKAHRQPTPLLGGLAIYAAFMLAVLLHLAAYFSMQQAEWFAQTFPFLPAEAGRLAETLPKLLAISAGATLMVVLGFVDDRRGLNFSYKIKFAIQILAAGLLVAAGVHTDLMPSPLLNTLVTVVWVVGITNAFNLLDNMDGLSAGVALIATAMLLVITIAQDQFFSAMALSVLAGALLGFLRYNFPPAGIFMGDTGSLFIGFLLAALSITSSYVVPQSASMMPALMPLLVLSLPIFDTLSVIVIRLREHRPVFQGDRRHFSHRLVDLGMTPRGAVVFIYLVTATIGIVAALLPYLPLWGEILVLLHTVLVYVMITVLVHVARRRRQEGAPASSRQPLPSAQPE
ncbi:MAG: undecaprenyl/decaprenyl-phosphate alpha-N-acetylglucosaminyl 1-phosphate transferase [candidate division KSB1 bacterium]|nr:undecaprenyl/decaprenyl-phosphate alpha-N-acetylglucosaminyl 1-phosphate transferase [candidate division KSB1 bacterium]MDZ7273778.1 undecaprenyl/decaprenyl-phosphate alpha-N-acetylglucosaminyl 1-phosphate transferase [candidate division KSB1 bacterium]MDZ7285934.1 undecaprenyl/decaprenyl-phosphate alpha-N-acetylglucosaminyl 1-phosphate transferase [candidate division KSB1 bacterium]MDZ7298966.1 undecaprenyl/decaprenyl-phosphate alpha-N-acetylglucosaminyl 1-phosphate transferase [candidate di